MFSSQMICAHRASRQDIAAAECGESASVFRACAFHAIRVPLPAAWTIEEHSESFT